MGSGIAQWLSSRGVSVILRDVSLEVLDRGLANIEKTYGEAVKRGLMSEEKAKKGRARIVASANPGPLREVQIVIEAASEKLEIKKAIFHDLDSKIDDTDILATNTSALSIGDPRGPNQTSGARHRTAFFQSGQPDETDRSRDRRANFRRDKGARPRLRPPDRQAAGGRAGTAPDFSSTAFFFPTCSTRRSFSSRGSTRRKSTRRWWSGGCRWARCV